MQVNVIYLKFLSIYLPVFILRLFKYVHLCLELITGDYLFLQKIVKLNRPRKTPYKDGLSRLIIRYYLRYTDADMKIYVYLHFRIKIICRRFWIIKPFTFWDISTWYEMFVYKPTSIQKQDNMLKKSLLFKKNTNFTGE